MIDKYKVFTYDVLKSSCIVNIQDIKGMVKESLNTLKEEDVIELNNNFKKYKYLLDDFFI